MDAGDFDFEFCCDIPNAEDRLRQEAERRLRELTRGHHDLIGASVAVEEWANKTTPFVYRARVVALGNVPSGLFSDGRVNDRRWIRNP